MDEDYFPPKEAEDVSLSTVNLQELLEPACPRCSDVRKSKKWTCITMILYRDR